MQTSTAPHDFRYARATETSVTASRYHSNHNGSDGHYLTGGRDHFPAAHLNKLALTPTVCRGHLVPRAGKALPAQVKGNRKAAARRQLGGPLCRRTSPIPHRCCWNTDSRAEMEWGPGSTVATLLKGTPLNGTASPQPAGSSRGPRVLSCQVEAVRSGDPLETLSQTGGQGCRFLVHYLLSSDVPGIITLPGGHVRRTDGSRHGCSRQHSPRTWHTQRSNHPNRKPQV